ncbi:MAG: NlpC/P60 family protein [Lachnospiraceae bacterium]|nr:NlpC/P60 family protein [Lachnospiraceae bacterium]
MEGSEQSQVAESTSSNNQKESLEMEKRALEGRKETLSAEAESLKSDADRAYQSRQAILAALEENQRKLADAEVSVSLAKDGIREIKTNQKDIRKALKQALREQRKVTRQKYDSPLEAARAKAEASKALVFQRTQLSLSQSEMKTARQEQKQTLQYYRNTKKEIKGKVSEPDQKILDQLTEVTEDWTKKDRLAREKEESLSDLTEEIAAIQTKLDEIADREKLAVEGEGSNHSRIGNGNSDEAGPDNATEDAENGFDSQSHNSKTGSVDHSLTGQKAVEAYGYKNPKTEGEKLVNYALQFVGNPYVWGGTSLTNGCDCSGFVQQVYKAFHINLTRTTATQLYDGRSVSYQEMQPGDVINYGSHTAIYIGNNRIVHAASTKSGIIVQDNPAYRQILDIRRMF